MSSAESRQPAEIPDNDLFNLYSIASRSAEASPELNHYGAEILRRRYRIEHRAAAAAEAAARAARWANIGIWAMGSAGLIGELLIAWRVSQVASEFLRQF
jgi:hypothetical protein